MNSESIGEAFRRYEPSLPLGDDDRVAGYGVIGLPFASGHYLALRCFGASSFGPPYTSLWHRDPDGAWTVYSTVDDAHGCPRYIGAALARPSIVTPIDVRLIDATSIRVYIDDAVDWTFQVTSTRATTLMSCVGAWLPEWAWANRWTLRVIGLVAGLMLSAGRLRLTGTMPNRQRFKAAPRRVWSIESSHATIEGIELGSVGPLAGQARLGDFWLPQRGIFFTEGASRFEDSGAR